MSTDSRVCAAVNLWGSGSFLLSLAPEWSRAKRLDTFYPVSTLRGYPYESGSLSYNAGQKRYYDDRGRFEFRYPARYVQDSAVFLRNSDAAYTRRMMDPTLANTPPAGNTMRPRRSTGPEVAFGPEGETKEENLSVVVGELVPGFTLRGTLGTPEEGAQRLLASSIAKEGLRETTLLGALERTSERSRLPLYQFE